MPSYVSTYVKTVLGKVKPKGHRVSTALGNLHSRGIMTACLEVGKLMGLNVFEVIPLDFN